MALLSEWRLLLADALPNTQPTVSKWWKFSVKHYQKLSVKYTGKRTARHTNLHVQHQLTEKQWEADEQSDVVSRSLLQIVKLGQTPSQCSKHTCGFHLTDPFFNGQSPQVHLTDPFFNGQSSWVHLTDPLFNGQSPWVHLTDPLFNGQSPWVHLTDPFFNSQSPRVHLTDTFSVVGHGSGWSGKILGVDWS